MTRVHFHSLDALRFFAFLKVYLLHIPLQASFPVFEFFKSGGGIGVSFFFVLSGFLISYLLINEKVNRGNVNVYKFLIRRSFRIWPLFLLIVLVAFLIPYGFKDHYGLHMIGGGYEFDWRYSFTFTENYKMLLEDNMPKTTPLSVFWSLCIEEHFYLIWVIALFFLPLKKIRMFFLISVVISWIARWIEPSIFDNEHINTNDVFTNLDYFAIGGILAYYAATQYGKLSIVVNGISRKFKTLITLIILSFVIFQNELLPYDPNSMFFIVRPTVVAILFTILLSMFIPQEGNFRIRSRVLSYLGKLSYGLYVYHLIFIHVIFQYFINHDIQIDNWYTLSGFIAITMTGSIMISSISYHYFEKPFLNLRERITKHRQTSEQ